VVLMLVDNSMIGVVITSGRVLIHVTTLADLRNAKGKDRTMNQPDIERMMGQASRVPALEATITHMKAEIERLNGRVKDLSVRLHGIHSLATSITIDCELVPDLIPEDERLGAGD
jgi:hypothetical protein